MPIIKNYTPKWKKFLDSKEDLPIVRNQLILGSNIFHFRKYKNLSQQELASQASTTQAIISDIENGDYNPSYELLSRLAQALEVKIEFLTKEFINWKMIEMVNYFISKISKKDIDILKAMKLLFFSDYQSKQLSGQKISNINYIRRRAGPFNKDIYILDDFFIKQGEYYTKPYFQNYIALEKKEMKFLDNIIEKYGDMSSKKLKVESYKTKVMAGCTIGGNEKMGEVIL